VVHRSRDGKSFRLSQPGYIEKMIEEFALQEVKEIQDGL